MSKQGKTPEKMHSPYADNFAHIAQELIKLDFIIRKRVLILRRQSKKTREITLDPKLYVSHEEVDHLLRQEKDNKKGNNNNDDLIPGLQEIRTQIETLREEIDARVSASLEAGVFLALPQLARLFKLSPFELQVVVICLAPQLQRKYDKIFVYLQDDIARKKPSIDLVLDLLCETEREKWYARKFFSSHAPLFRAGILQVSDDPHSPSASSDLASFLKPDPRILDFLQENNRIDKRLSGTGAVKLYNSSLSIEDVLIDPVIKNRVMNITRSHLAIPEPGVRKLVLHFYGPTGVGKRDLALGIVHQLGCLLLYLDMELLSAEPEPAVLLRLAYREGLLLQAILYIDNIDGLLYGDSRSRTLFTSIFNVVTEYGGITFLAGDKPWSYKRLPETIVFSSTHLPVPAVELRENAWAKALEGKESKINKNKAQYAAEMARQFRLTPGQIRDAVEFAWYQYVIGNQQTELSLRDMYAACRKQSNQKLTELALKIEPKYRWKDIVLPREKVLQLKEICSQVKYRHQVFGQWGFDEKLSHGKGLSVLFTGPPGTGKTMAAEVMARHLQLDLYKIDLAGVVSKYIGETEKNLARIFYEAETSNAILFFDEADALFGKRTEISDAHDRYANIEVSYLLQKMEEYEGIVILATNFRQNIDDAFTRRIRFILQFPFPDETSRSRIWETHFPGKAPLAKKIDYTFLGKQFQVTGASIRNIVLGAAFYAVQNSGVIEMKHIFSAARREYEKIGKLWPHGVGSL